MQVALDELDREAGVALHRQLFDRLRDAIISGRIPPGGRLPSTRALNAALGVSRNTAIEALAQLVAEGYVTSIRGSGTFVSLTPPASVGVAPRAPACVQRSRPAGPQPPLSSRGASLRDAGAALRARWPAIMRPFDLGPGASHLPVRVWRAALSAAEAEAGRRWPSAGGEPELRRALAQHLRTARGMNVARDHVFVVRGVGSALDLIVRLVTDPGDTVWLEDPAAPQTRAGLDAGGLRMTHIAVDIDGFSVAQARGVRERPRAIVVRPSSQFPLGTTMTMRRRREILELAADLDAWVIEDDSDSAYRYSGAPLPSLQALDAAGHVIQFGTLRDILFPLAEPAYVVAPGTLVEGAASAVRTLDPPAPVVDQLALQELIESRQLERLIRRVRHANSVRRDALLAGLHPLPPGVTVQEAETGGHALLWLDGDDVSVAEDAARRGVSVFPLSPLYANAPCHGLLLGYAAFAPEHLRAHAVELRDTLARVR
ncbi:MAG: PLP-dependent aminotransferase family protein [Candidatus Dormibacteraeota bacterium]|nr:PLP-dependent aminotransferase family protein [Candidatus Dormibacteraeota bacterium]MBV9526501.1 PLP-dependent aminotransferase family protein [Candidatus Dormibacteraeota bacterium]